MLKHVLVPVNGVAEDAPAMATALLVGRAFNAHITALHARPDIRHEIAALTAPDMGLGLTAGIDDLAASLELDADGQEKMSAAAWAAFRDTNGITLADAPGAHGVSGEWRREVGDPADLVAEFGRSADLIVAGRAHENGVTGLDILEAALMDSGRPLLVVPDQAPDRLDGPVVIAWKNTREAAKAVAAAQPFIARASGVVVLTVRESGETDADPSATRLVRALRWHNANVSLRGLPRSGSAPVETLLAATREAGATLLVMGGYGHTRLREAVFGGFTRAVLETAPLPVLMAH